MPNIALERAARHHVQHLRQAAETGCSYANLSPDAYTLGPLVKAHAAALADLLEYYLDVEGGADGVAATRDFLLTAAATLLGCEYDEQEQDEDVAPLAAEVLPTAAPEPAFAETDMRRASEGLLAEAREPVVAPLITDVPNFSSSVTKPVTMASRRSRRLA